MDKLKRYNIEATIDCWALEEDENGKYVYYEDVEKELEKVKKEIKKWKLKYWKSG